MAVQADSSAPLPDAAERARAVRAMHVLDRAQSRIGLKCSPGALAKRSRRARRWEDERKSASKLWQIKSTLSFLGIWHRCLQPSSVQPERA